MVVDHCPALTELEADQRMGGAGVFAWLRTEALHDVLRIRACDGDAEGLPPQLRPADGAAFVGRQRSRYGLVVDRPDLRRAQLPVGTIGARRTVHRIF